MAGEAKSSRETSTSTNFQSHGGDSLHLHGEIEMLKTQIVMKDDQINKLETSVFRGHHLSEGHISFLQDEINNTNDKYDRLFDAHRRIQKVNQNLEEKLLKIADRFENERSALLAEISILQRKVLDAKVTITELQEENERYKSDCHLAVHLLQCQPSNFVSQRLEYMPTNIQERLVENKSVEKPVVSAKPPQLEEPAREEVAMTIATFPPTAMVFSVNKKQKQHGVGSSGDSVNGSDLVSSAAIARVLQPRRSHLNSSSSATHRTRMYLCKSCKGEVDVCERSVQTCAAGPRTSASVVDIPQTHSSGGKGRGRHGEGSHLARSDSTTSSGSRESEV